MESGEVIVIQDFSDIADPKTVSKTLTRLEKSGDIKKVMRGVFWKPDGEKPSPDPDSVARGLARGNMWKLAPSGDTALHIIGMSNEKPKIWTYVTDGTYRSYCYDGIIILFQHTTGKALSAMSEKTALLIQVLKAYGKEHISDDLLKKLTKFFKPGEVNTVLEESKNTTEWVAKAIKSMFSKKMNKVTE